MIPDRAVRRIAAENLIRAYAKVAAKAGEVLFFDRPALVTGTGRMTRFTVSCHSVRHLSEHGRKSRIAPR